VYRSQQEDRGLSRSRSRAGFAAACALILGAVGATQSASGAAAGQWIVFSAAPDGLLPNQLFRMKTDGTGLQQITHGNANATEPSFSPKGTKIVFARLGRGIYVAKPDGTAERRLTTGAHDLFPVWSPNGKSIAFVRLYKGDYRLYLMSSTGAHKHRVRNAPPSGRPSWTSNSKSLFVPRGSLDKIDARTGKPQKHYEFRMDVPQATTLSPNTKKLAFYGPRPSLPGCGEVSCLVNAVYLANVPGGVRKFVNDGGPAGWSSDGKRLVFVYRGGIALWPVSGGAHTLLTTEKAVPAGDAPPAWQPTP
jgi:Tol biopolymer transport system component